MFTEKARATVLNIRRYGVPYEETIALPILVLIFTAVALDRHQIELWLGGSSVFVVWCICGFWLGIAWEGFPAIKVTLRVWLMAILSVAGYSMFTEISYPKELYIHNSGSISESLGFVFYSFWFLGSSIRESLIVPLTDEQKAIGARRKLRMQCFFMGVLALREDQMQWEIIFGHFL